jgi:hypothetical protein
VDVAVPIQRAYASWRTELRAGRMFCETWLEIYADSFEGLESFSFGMCFAPSREQIAFCNEGPAAERPACNSDGALHIGVLNENECSGSFHREWNSPN